MRMKILPDNLFSTLWSEAEKHDDKSEYINKFTSYTSKDVIRFKANYDIEIEEAYNVLSEIFDKQHMTFKEILEAAGKTKAEISHSFCIPYRTVEDWYRGKAKCASYIRLSILRQYHLINLGKHIYTELEEEYKTSKPAVYRKQKNNLEPIVQKKEEPKQIPKIILSSRSEILLYEKLAKMGIRSVKDLTTRERKIKEKAASKAKSKQLTNPAPIEKKQEYTISSMFKDEDELDDWLENYEPRKFDESLFNWKKND